MLCLDIQKHTEKSEHPRIARLQELLQTLGDLNIGSFGFRRTVSRIESIAYAFTRDIQIRIVLEIQKALEHQIENWLISGSDAVYNLLDILNGTGYNATPYYLQAFDERWFLSRRSRFIVFAKRGHDAAMRLNHRVIAEKLESFFPEFSHKLVSRHMLFEGMPDATLA